MPASGRRNRSVHQAKPLSIGSFFPPDNASPRSPTHQDDAFVAPCIEDQDMQPMSFTGQTVQKSKVTASQSDNMISFWKAVHDMRVVVVRAHSQKT